MDAFWYAYKRKKDKIAKRKCRIDDVKARLARMIRRGHSVIIRGHNGTGKTNLALLFFEAGTDPQYKRNCDCASNNPTIEGFTFINNFDDLYAWLEDGSGKLKIFLFDDAAKIFSARRSGSKKHAVLRELLTDLKKKRAFLIVVEHYEKQVEIDVRRASNWVLDKPYEERLGEDIDDVPLYAKQEVEAKRNNVLKWWSDQIPKSRIYFDENVAGEWVGTRQETRLRAQDTSYEGLKVTIVEQKARPDLVDAVIKRLKAYDIPDYVDLFKDWLKGESQRALSIQTGIPQTSISHYFKQIRNSIGFAFEDVFCSENPHLTQGGSNTPEPDAIDKVAKICYSLKCYADPKLNLADAVKSIAKSEISLLKQGWSLRLVLLELFSRVIYVYNVAEQLSKNEVS